MLSNYHLLLLTKLLSKIKIFHVSINEKITSVRDRTFLVNHFPSSLFNIWKRNVDDDFMKKSFRKGKEKLTNGQKCTSLAVLRMHLMIEKNDKCHFIGEEIQNWFYRQKPQTLPDYFEVCMYYIVYSDFSCMHKFFCYNDEHTIPKMRIE